jgi:hypothetical protein
MKSLMRKLDDLLFSPPHTFATILTIVALRLQLDFYREEVQDHTGVSTTAEQATHKIGATKRRD